ncbi:MAG: hypothetical protein AB8H80_04930 [Planctomycetota bacterium]
MNRLHCYLPFLRPSLTLLLGLLAFDGSARTQDQATTLARLAARADVVVDATVADIAQPNAAMLLVQMRKNALLKGSLPSAAFALTEPAGRCCGRALFGLQPGDRCLVFLRRTGAMLHPLGGGRGVLPWTAARANHAGALLATAANPAALAHQLALTLSSEDPRLRSDAAMALAALPELNLTSMDRLRVRTALSESVQRGHVHTAPLADVAGRLADATMVDTVLPLFLDAAQQDQAALLQRALLRLPPELVVERMPSFVQPNRGNNLRAAQLLTRLPSQIGRSAMTSLLQSDCHPQVQLHLCEGLLAAGVARSTLQPLVPKVVLELAQTRQITRPVFRNIRPRR